MTNLTFEAVGKLQQALKIEFDVDPEEIQVRLPDRVLYVMYEKHLRSKPINLNKYESIPSTLSYPECWIYGVYLRGSNFNKKEEM